MKPLPSWTFLACACSAVLALSACGGGGDGATGANGTNGINGQTTLIASAPEAAGANCAAGGFHFNAGLDTNRNGTLDANEVNITQYACNGASGTPGVTGATGATGTAVLMALLSEVPGSNCTHGGTRVVAGPDANGDGILQFSEVTASRFICDPAPAGLTWINLLDSSAQALPNRGYIVSHPSKVTITLPPTASLNVGDVVRINGLGAGGWELLQNAGQSIRTTVLNVLGAAGETWIGQSTLHRFISIASSSDGSKLFAAATYALLTSSDSGQSWVERVSDGRRWVAVASSSDGYKLVAAEEAGLINTSTDGGLTWTPRFVDRSWASVASSSDGNKLVAVVRGGQIYTSNDGGVSWTARDRNRNWWSVASSSDGNKLVAVVRGGQIYTSTNSGVDWTARDSDRLWQSVASSSDGSKLVAVLSPGFIYTSSDSGVSWTARDNDGPWHSVASSSDGRRLVASNSGGQIFTSTNSGINWTLQRNIGGFTVVASSGDGSKFFAATSLDTAFYTSVGSLITNSTVGTTGGISGAANSKIELQYIGNGEFDILSVLGSLNVQ
jgi:hypothetical protein